MHVVLMDMGSNVAGESALPGFESKIELLSFSHGVAMQVTGDASGAGRTSGRPIHQDVSVTKYLDRTAPLLNICCCQGLSFAKVEIIVGRHDGGPVTELLRYVLSDVIISSITVAGGGDGRPVEVLTLNYSKISWKFTHPSGAAVVKTWNVERNTSE